MRFVRTVLCGGSNRAIREYWALPEFDIVHKVHITL
jgi:hypothetical protein